MILPLWAARDLGLTAGEWSLLRSTRVIGTFGMMVLLTIITPWLTPTSLATGALLLTALAIAAMSIFGETGLFVWVMLLGGGVSASFVGINALTQLVSRRRQGSANAAVRGAITSGKLLAPIAATSAASLLGGYLAVLASASVLLVLAAGSLAFFPIGRDTHPARRGSEATGRASTRIAKRVADAFVSPLRNRPLQKFIHLSEVPRELILIAPGFAAIRLVTDMGQPDAIVGVTVTSASIGTLLASFWYARHLDSASLRKTKFLISVSASLAIVAAGLAANWWMLAGAIGLMCWFANFNGAPMSMWISRVTGALPISSSLTHHKLVSSGYGVVVALAFAALEPHIGLASVLITLGVAGVVTSFPILLLEEPDPSSTHL
ncbi:MAG: hypothetical protein AAGI46_04955 [Planctomycetota bacterium]